MVGPPRPELGTPKRGVWPMRRMRLRHRHRRRLPSMSVIPTLCTLGNLIAGFAAIHYAARGLDEPNVHLLWRDWTPLTFAGALIFLGMFLDAIDGSLARLTRSTSELGGQLDSLADVVTFGVAPAFMTIRLVMNHIRGEEWIIGPEADTLFGKIIWAAAAVYVCCAALRLARFNVELGPGSVNDHSLFRGMPSPGAAGTVASLVILHQQLVVWYAGTPVQEPVRASTYLSLGFIEWGTLLIPLIMVLCAFGMVSNIPYIHFANRYFRGPRDFGYIVRVVVVLALAIWWFQFVVAIGFTIYALSGPVRTIWSKFKRRRMVHQPAP
jgi:CDP-diacylglycerol---serine O-phosphatidyltransferase